MATTFLSIGTDLYRRTLWRLKVVGIGRVNFVGTGHEWCSDASSSSVSTPPVEDTETGSLEKDDKFDWFCHWYALMPVCDLDKRAPLGKKVLGLDVVVWWDRNQNEWKVFDDRCPHRLAPLSEGRIDQKGRLQCVYHGWCFGGSGDCMFIPQAPHDGPPVIIRPTTFKLR
ncbi:hypothetical protein R6Q59_026461 [Mikania micrantha]